MYGVRYVCLAIKIKYILNNHPKSVERENIRLHYLLLLLFQPYKNYNVMGNVIKLFPLISWLPNYSEWKWSNSLQSMNIFKLVPIYEVTECPFLLLLIGIFTFLIIICWKINLGCYFPLLYFIIVLSNIHIRLYKSHLIV